jgi:predicted Na+-dependent transporter
MFRNAPHPVVSNAKRHETRPEKPMPSTRAPISESERTLSSLCIAGAILTGVASPTLSAALFPFIFHFLFLAVAFSLAALNANILEIVGRVDRTCRIALAWQMIGIPAIVTVLCTLFDSDPATAAVLITTTTAGSVFASPALADLVGLDRRAAVRATILSTILMPLSLLAFGGLNGLLPPELSLLTYLQHIVYFLVAPMVIAAIYWEASPKIGARRAAQAARLMHWGATLALMGFCFGVMSKLHGPEVQDGRVLHYILLVTATVLPIYLITALLFARLGWRGALTIGMLAANRNVALSCALVGDLLPDDVLFYVAIAQFPIFLSPILIRTLQALFDGQRRGRGVLGPG